MSQKAKDVWTPPPTPSKPIIPNWLITGVVVAVMVMWGVSIIYSARNPDWPVPPSVHAAVVAVVTGLMGYLAIKGRGNGTSNGSK